MSPLPKVVKFENSDIFFNMNAKKPFDVKSKTLKCYGVQNIRLIGFFIV